jgi:AcrR family transcriptional regulator
MAATGPPTFIRCRNAAATRAGILAAARLRFAQEGYDGASLRDIASDAGVDAALVSRYFGSKEDLFLEVLHGGGTPDELWQGDPADFGRRVARMLVVEPADNAKLDKLLIILRSASSPKAADAIRRHGLETFYGPFEAWLGGPDAAVRARAAASVIMGFAVSRAIDDTYGLDEGELDKLCARLADMLQRAID